MSAQPLKLFYCDHYELPLPAGHKFPAEKYRLIRQELSCDPRFALDPAQFVTREDLLRVHEAHYIGRFLDGTLERMALRRIGFPWSEALVKRTLASVGGTLLAVRAALRTGFGGTLAGGTHHAFRAEGSGFCVFNDIAVAIEWARANTPLRRYAVIDLDVHQGDGTAAIFGNDSEVFTLSVHGARNFPFRKQKSRLDIELPDGADDELFLSKLWPALDEVWAFDPQLVLFQSGVDGLQTDRLGRLGLSLEGLAERDRMVMGQARGRAVPLAVTIGGGYSNPIDPTVAAHVQTFLIAADLYASG